MFSFAEFLKTFFNALYDEDVIAEDTFYNWKTSTDPAEEKGKGLAKASTQKGVSFKVIPAQTG